MTSLSLQATKLVLTAGDVNRLRSWAVMAREQAGGGKPGWSTEDVKLLNYLDDILIHANELIEC